MTRQERRAVNRANATRSTGPATADGKATSSQNATTHGLTSLKPYLPAEEQDYKTYLTANLARLDPQSAAEQNLAQTIIDFEWRLKRIPSLEARLFADEEADTYKIIRALDVLSRHEIRLRKLLVNALVDLNNLILERRKLTETMDFLASRNANGFVLKSPIPAAQAANVDADLAASAAFPTAQSAQAA